MGVRGLITILTVTAFCLVAIGTAPGDAAAMKKKDGKAGKQGYLGVTMQNLTDDIIEGLDLKVMRGVLINEVIEDSPAEEAGLEDGDVIIVYSGNKITSSKELIKLVRATAVGDKVKLKVVRDHDTKTLLVTIGEKPEEFAWTVEDDGNRIKDTFVRIFRPGVQLGVKIQDLDNEDFASYFDVEEGEGVLVMGVEKESSAEEAGVKAGDVIIRLDDEDIGSAEELIEAVQEKEEGDEFKLVVKRHGRTKTLTGEMKEGKGLQNFYFSGDLPKFSGDKKFSFHMDGDHLEGLINKCKDFKWKCREWCDDEEYTDECLKKCLKIRIGKDHFGDMKHDLRKLDRHIIIEKDDLKAELKELKRELLKLKERLDEIEKD